MFFHAANAWPASWITVSTSSRVPLKLAKAVAAALFALGGQHVHQLIVEHHAEEFARFGRQRVVKRLAGVQRVLRSAGRLCFAGAEHHGVVGKAHGIRLAESFRFVAENPVGQRYQIGAHGFAELFYVVLVIAVAAHAVVAQRDIAAVAELFAHRIAQMYELVIQFVKLRLVVFVPLAFSLPRGKASFVVGILFERTDLRDGIALALKRNLRARQQLFIRLHQIVFLLQLRDDFRRKRLELDLGVEEHHAAVFPFEVRAKRTFEQRLCPFLLILLHLGQNGVEEIRLRFIKRVARVDRVAHFHKRA